MTTSPVDRPQHGGTSARRHGPGRVRAWSDRVAVGTEQAAVVVALGSAVVLAVVAFDLLLAERLTLFFDLCFVVLCLALALAVRGEDFFATAVLPPLLMLATFLLLAATRPTALAAADHGVVQTVVTGLAHHSVALVAGHLLCLATLALRRRAPTRPGPTQASWQQR